MGERNNGATVYVSYSRRGTYDLTQEGRQIAECDNYRELRETILKKKAESPSLRLVPRRGIDRKTIKLLEKLVN